MNLFASPTLILIIMNVLASLYAWNDDSIYRKWIMNPYKTYREKQYYRFITSGFIHANWPHLIFNMIALYSFGHTLEANLSYHVTANTGVPYGVYYYALYTIALVVSDLPSYLKNKNNPGYNSLGASGAVSAVIFACILFSPLEEIYFLPGFIMGGLYLLYSYTISQRRADGINHDAHFYGAVCGVVFIIVLYPPALTNFLMQISQWNMSLFQ